jgi:hypothetical protein
LFKDKQLQTVPRAGTTTNSQSSGWPIVGVTFWDIRAILSVEPLNLSEDFPITRLEERES